jgi:hypothetical protein
MPEAMQAVSLATTVDATAKEARDAVREEGREKRTQYKPHRHDCDWVRVIKFAKK